MESPENADLLIQLYKSTDSALIRRDIILILGKWNTWYWLSDKRRYFRMLSAPERRAFIIASFSLQDEGRHWRDHIKKEFSDFENIINNWAAEKNNS